jgi:hypothetical protein
MAKFDAAQAAAVVTIQQVINEWSEELDSNDGRTLIEADVLTQDCRYFVGGQWHEGLAAAAQFYRDRWDRLQASGGAPVMRHLITNYRISFTADDHAEVGFLLLFFAKTGEPPFVDYCDPSAVADVQMECRREADGHSRISMFNSGQIFRRG